MKNHIFALILSVFYIPASIVGGLMGKIFAWVGSFLTDYYKFAAPIVEGIFSGIIAALFISFLIKLLLKLQNTKEVFFTILLFPLVFTVIGIVFGINLSKTDMVVLSSNFITYILFLKHLEKDD